ncbi:MAG: hypothetical protein M3552_22745, partial [Planctomycetota bacterium]|nr:hypothetical protein [Planctomycetota bacterium]
MPRSVSSHRLAACGRFRRSLGVIALLMLMAVPAVSQQPAGGPAADPNPAPAKQPAAAEEPAEPAAAAPANTAPAAPDAPLPP